MRKTLLMGIALSSLLLGGGRVSHAQAPDPQATVSRTLAWNAVVTNTDGTPAALTGYQMYRSTDNGGTFAKQLPVIPPSVLVWTDAAVPAGNICYEVAAMNAVGESTRSNRVCFSMPTSIPNAPTGLSIVGGMVPVAPPAARRPGH